jgi:hypothetical protein
MSAEAPLIPDCYEGLVYFEGPLSKWTGSVDEREVVWRQVSRWRFWAVVVAQARCRGLARCKWIVRQGRQVIAGELPERAGV